MFPNWRKDNSFELWHGSSILRLPSGGEKRGVYQYRGVWTPAKVRPVQLCGYHHAKIPTLIFQVNESGLTIVLPRTRLASGVLGGPRCAARLAPHRGHEIRMSIGWEKWHRARRRYLTGPSASPCPQRHASRRRLPISLMTTTACYYYYLIRFTNMRIKLIEHSHINRYLVLTED